MRVILRAVALVVLAGCAAEPEVELPSYRDRTVPIASQVDVVFEDLDGSWRVRGALGSAANLIQVRIDVEARSMRELGGLQCPVEFTCDPFGTTYDLASFAQGRFEAKAIYSLSVGEITNTPSVEYWILWADADRRTLAIGTPDGSFGFILDRNDTGGDDRIAAARDIMAWMGYRVDEMVTR